MKRLAMLPVLLSFFTFTSSSSAQESNNIIVQRYSFKIEENKTFFDKTLEQAGSKEGKLVIGAIATYFGVPPTAVGVAVAAIQPRDAGIEHYRDIISPSGYTICFAKPVGSQYNGVETTQDSTFNAVIRRPIPGRSQMDGLSIYMVVPHKVGRVRAMSTFDVAFVRNPPGVQQYPQCRPTGEAAWLSRNNNTRLNVACPEKSLCP